ncbi:thiol:disulfide interchange protein DsbA/DsbL [Shewanella surugensis]|uniref:Thiol:disulfide interchange protein n=1 Tax=Shewanella surugensis TaxID=212020 RepID=A0ABT0LGA5_9GAMM|nr:thiol:disulfide interchange protein DsbA/DsbL [Shewanella surugensis]MCL1126737.1 thiol:disulfide interchange protein DsbA/DsbL [Shewanella surugensis]
MKKILLLIMGLVMTPMNVSATEYKEGTHYTVIRDTASTTPEITSFFSFYCQHCYQFALSEIPKMKAELPEGVSFKQVQVAAVGGKMGEDMSRAFAIAQLLNVEDVIEPALFSAVHQEGVRFTHLDDIKRIFVTNGVDSADFDAAAASFMVSSKVAQMDRAVSEANIVGVPTLIVNGKYRVETGAIKSYDEMRQIAYYLTGLK